jgi:CBS domain containing-hemolysin-like protein
MGLAATFLVLAIAAAASFLFATLVYSLRDFSRTALAAWFEKRGRLSRLDAVVDSEDELLLAAASARAAANLVVIITLLHLLTLLFPRLSGTWLYAMTFVAGFLFIGLVAVVLPLVLAKHAAEPIIGMFSGLLRLKRVLLFPILKLHAPVDAIVRRVTGHGPADNPEVVEEELEQEILEIVQEGREEGVIDEAERERIERVLRFQDATAAQAMTARPQIVAVPINAPMSEVLRVIDESGYSRVPAYAGSLDKIIGVVYARDLFRYVGHSLNGGSHKPLEDGHARAALRAGEIREDFRLARVMRQPLFVPRTKPLADLLRDFQQQKVHMAIVIDEYGGTAGLVTIEDVLEELVGEIADEHEYDETPMFRRIDEDTAEIDARLPVEDLNRLLGLAVPEDQGFGTLGGFITTVVEGIPQAGGSFEHEVAGANGSGSRRLIVTVLDAEPQRVNRVRVVVQSVGPAPGASAAVAAPISAAGGGS